MEQRRHEAESAALLAGFIATIISTVLPLYEARDHLFMIAKVRGPACGLGAPQMISGAPPGCLCDGPDIAASMLTPAVHHRHLPSAA